MAIQHAIDNRAAMPSEYHPAAKATQNGQPQRSGQELFSSNSQDALETDPSQHDQTSQLQSELDEYTQSQRINDIKALSGPSYTYSTIPPTAASAQINTSSSSYHFHDQLIAPPTEHPDRTHQRNEEQVSTFLDDLETYIQCTNPALYSRLRSQYPSTSTGSNQAIRASRPTYIAASLFGTSEVEILGGPRQSGANLVPVSGRRRGFDRGGGGDGDSGQITADKDGGAVVEVEGGGRGEDGSLRGRRVVDTRDCGGRLVFGDGLGRAAVCGDIVSRVEDQHSSRGAMAGPESANAFTDMDMEAEEGEERPQHDWSRTADW